MASFHLLTVFWSAFALAAIVGALAIAWAVARHRKRRGEAPPREDSAAP